MNSRDESGTSGYHHGNLAAALKEAAVNLIKEKGVSGFTLAEASRLAEVSTAAPYRHFADRDALLAALALDANLALEKSMDAAIQEAAGESFQELRGCGIALGKFALEYPSHYQVLFGPFLNDRSGYPELEASDRKNFATLRDVIERAQADGFVQAGSSETLALAAMSIVTGIVNLRQNGSTKRFGIDSSNGTQILVEISDLLYLGLAPR